MKTIGVVGTRSRDTMTDYLAVKKAFDNIYEYGDKIASGGCPRGGDKFADYIAKIMGLTIIIHYPGPDKPASYFKRNTLVAMDADILIACVSADRTGGTEDTISKFCRFKHKDPILV